MSNHIYVWSKFIRIFHWVLVLAFITSFLSGENEWEDIHTYSGYLLAVLIFTRIITGCLSNGYASFTDFVYPPRHIFDYSKKLITGKAPRYIGHNPLGGLMVLIMLILLILTVLTGLVQFGIGEYAGPLYFLADMDSADLLISIAEQVHETTSHLMLPAIALHILGVIINSLYHKENLVRSMVNGIKEQR